MSLFPACRNSMRNNCQTDTPAVPSLFRLNHALIRHASKHLTRNVPPFKSNVTSPSIIAFNTSHLPEKIIIRCCLEFPLLNLSLHASTPRAPYQSSSSTIKPLLWPQFALSTSKHLHSSLLLSLLRSSLRPSLPLTSAQKAIPSGESLLPSLFVFWSCNLFLLFRSFSLSETCLICLQIVKIRLPARRLSHWSRILPLPPVAGSHNPSCHPK